jgi:hypothetical protein
VDTIDILILILAGLHLAFYVAKLGCKVCRYIYVKIKYRRYFKEAYRDAKKKV